MDNKKIIVVYTGDDWKETIPISGLETRKSFEDFHNRGIKKGIEIFRASIDWYDTKNNKFIKSWAYRNGKWLKVKKPVKPDLIFDKIAGKYDFQLFDWKMEISKKVKFFNHPLFRVIFDNKFTQYIYLKEFMAKSFLVTNKKELLTASKEIKSSKIVVKPLYGSGGSGIIINEKNKAVHSKIKYPVLVQEFVKSDKGIPGFSKRKEVSDLRMIFINRKLIYALSRVAKKGSLFTNFHKGATAILVKDKFIPLSAKKTANQIIKKLSIFPEANYSLDFIFKNSGKPVLVEMNTTPGFDLLHIVGTEAIKKKHFEEFMKVLKC
jgi:glutathione synthase/RimK-type ligase-like ATP-grasp enzyme